MVRVAVIGCGALGIKITGTLAYSGHEVRVHDNDKNSLNKVHLRLSEERRILKEDGLLLSNNFVGEVYGFTNLEDVVRGTSIIFESIPDDLNAKKTLFKKIEECCSNETILATASMKLSVDEIFEDVINKSRCVGIRFLYPVYYIPEVEVWTCKATSVETLDKVRQFLNNMGRVAFFRSSNEPIVLNEEQRESRKKAFIRDLNENKGVIRRINQLIPNLGGINDTEISSTAIESTFEQLTRKDNECVVCMDNDRDYVLHPCHHLCVCMKCGTLLFKRQDSCPICRQAITNAFRVFHS